MSEQQPQPTSAETGSVSATPESRTEIKADPVMVESPATAPDQELTSPMADAPKTEPKVDAPKAEKVEAPKAEVEAEKAAEALRPAGKVMIMAPGERAWSGEAKASEPAAPKRRIGAMAAVIALAAVAGAIGGALATAGLGQGNAIAGAPRNVELEAAVARIDADIVALKASVEQSAKLGVTQFNKTSDRLDKVEKAQAEPAARLAKLSDEVSKLRAAPATAPVVAAAPAQAAVAAAPATTTVPKDITGSVTPAAAATPPKPEVARLPTVQGWVLRDVGHGGALIESRRGIFEIYAGDSIPG
ncbi:MAG: hypothetical protein GY873_29350, partial [Bosea sp.]|uniref:hypothetical protein n=1 Tax=Bosea sp. (in: a-proteobacteria) TaxID=1871050 RepID=UPI00239A43A4|nr:hypothetical protein [Bosea sp. (in: a-proteobacteria)]